MGELRRGSKEYHRTEPSPGRAKGCIFVTQAAAAPEGGDLPNIKLSNDILGAHVNRSNQFQKERSKFLYTPERIQTYINELWILIDDVWGQGRIIFEQSEARAVEQPQSPEPSETSHP